MQAFLFCLRENFRSIWRSITVPLILLIAIAFIVTYSLAYPSYLSFKERSTESPPWSAEVDFTSRDRAAVDELAVELSETFDQAKTVDSCRAEGFITTNKRVMNNASGVSLELVSTSLLNQPSKTIYPIDVYVPVSFVLAGDPYSGDGLLIDALTAQKHKVTVGDKLYIGLLFPKGSKGGQSIPIPGVSSQDPEGMAEDIVFIEKTISAVVKPSSQFEGIALFQPSESVLAYEQEGEASCTQLYLFGKTQDEMQEGWDRVKNNKSMNGVYFRLASEEVQWAKDVYAQDLGGKRIFVLAMVAGALVVFFLLILDGLRRQQGQMRNLAVLLSLGTKKAALALSYSYSVLVLYGLIVIFGCTVGFFIASSAYPMWVYPGLKLEVASVVAVVTLLAVALQSGILTLRLKRMDVYDFLSEERE